MPFINYSQYTTFRVEREEDETYYDFHVPGYENYFASGLFHHNTGKSTMLHNLVEQLMQRGYGLMLLEPKGDLVEDVLRSVPNDRVKDVILFDPSDTQFPIGFNILADPNPERITGHVLSLFESIYSDSWGPRLAYILRNAVLTAALKGLTLYDVKQLLVSPPYRRSVLRGLKNPELTQFWQNFEKMADNSADSVINKLDAFLGYSAIRNIISQPSSFDMNHVLSEGKILLVPLASGLIGDANASMLGSILMLSAWQAARGRAGIARDSRKPFFYVVDEFQNFLNLPVAIGDALAQARGYGVGMVLANQHLDQLKPDVKAGVLANARSKIAFQTAHKDASALQAEFQPYLAASDLQNLGRYEAVMKLMANDQSLPAATVSMPAPPRPVSSGRAVREASRALYGTPVSQVEQAFRDRHAAADEAKKPSIGAEQ